LHIELSSDLTTETFPLAFTRFAARRGPIKEFHSDCVTNFVGSVNLLNPLHTFIASELYQNSVRDHLSKDQITSFFNPLSSPHFGELWEAGLNLRFLDQLEHIDSQMINLSLCLPKLKPL